MESNFFYYKWFRKTVSFLTDLLLYAIPFLSLYVLTSFLSGMIRIAAFVLLVIFYFLIIRFFKDKIYQLLSAFYKKCETMDRKTMIIILSLVMIIGKIIATVFFSFDSTGNGDIGIYNEIAERIYTTGNIHSSAISHLFGIALHFVVFKYMHLPLHVGMFIAFFIGTIVNFISFSDLMGKEKTFMILLVYTLMPSSFVISFCLTHELFVYMYLSLFLLCFVRFLRSAAISKTLAYLLGMIVFTVLTCFVNPVGYIIYVIFVLSVLFSNADLRKKAMIIAALLASLCLSNVISGALEVNEYNTTVNTYTILIHGSNPESLGEQVDGYPEDQMRDYLRKYDLSFKPVHFLEGYRAVLLEQYAYLLTHPATLLRLVAHKLYILWSGVHYPLELAHFYDAMPMGLYLLLLAINALIYLFVITAGNVFAKKQDDGIDQTNYKLTLLGIFGVTMLSVVLNKYSIYATAFLYYIVFMNVRFTDD